MLNKLIRYFKGYLYIRVTGNAIERFINTCSYRGINLWNLSSHNSYYEMYITIKDFKKLKPVIRKTRTKVIILKRAGFPFYIQKFYRRKLLFIGFFIFISLLYIFSSFIWNINITGNQTYSTEDITRFLNSIDIEIGIKKKYIDCHKITRIIRQNYDDIIWVSASLEGSNLNIEIKENEDSKEVKIKQENNDAYDIVADRDCQITRLIVRKGIASVKQGDFIKKGTILISGQIPIYNDAKEIVNYQSCTSDADIYGKTQIYYEDELSLIINEKVFQDIAKHEYFIQSENYRITLGGINNDYEHYKMYSKYDKKGNIRYGIRSVYPYITTKIKYTTTQIRQILSANFQYYCKELEKKGVVILQNDVKIYTWSDKAKATGVLTVELPIGQKEKSEIIEIGDHIDGNDGNNN